MSEMVKRVVRAIIRAEDECSNLYMDEPSEMYAAVARAAIVAMQDPTEDMLAAGARVITERNGDIAPEAEWLARLAWPVMIQTASK